MLPEAGALGLLVAVPPLEALGVLLQGLMALSVALEEVAAAIAELEVHLRLQCHLGVPHQLVKTYVL